MGPKDVLYRNTDECKSSLSQSTDTIQLQLQWGQAAGYQPRPQAGG